MKLKNDNGNSSFKTQEFTKDDYDLCVKLLNDSPSHRRKPLVGLITLLGGVTAYEESFEKAQEALLTNKSCEPEIIFEDFDSEKSISESLNRVVEESRTDVETLISYMKNLMHYHPNKYNYTGVYFVIGELDKLPIEKLNNFFNSAVCLLPSIGSINAFGLSHVSKSMSAVILLAEDRTITEEIKRIVVPSVFLDDELKQILDVFLGLNYESILNCLVYSCKLINESYVQHA